MPDREADDTEQDRAARGVGAAGGVAATSGTSAETAGNLAATASGTTTGTAGNVAATTSGATTGTAAGAGPAGTGASTGTTVTHGKLLAAGGICAAVVVGVVLYLLLRPPAQTDSAPTATTSSTPPLAAPVAAAPDKPTLQGRYDYVGTVQNFTLRTVFAFASDCPLCDATLTADGVTGTYAWNGEGWELSHDGQCGPMVDVVTPTDVVDGVVQKFALARTYVAPPPMCTLRSGELGSGTLIED